MVSTENLEKLKEDFLTISQKNPVWSSHTCFLHLVRNKKFTYEEVEELFSHFVEKDDYQNRYRISLIDYAFSQTRKSKSVKTEN